MTLPLLKNWDETAHSLHQAAFAIGALRLTFLPHQHLWQEFAMKVVPEGVSTDVLPNGIEVVLDYTQQAYRIHRPGESPTATIVPLQGHTQQSAFEALLAELKLPATADAADGERVDALIKAMEANLHEPLDLRKDLTGDDSLTINALQATDYARIADTVFTGIARFRARLMAALTPVVIWPEHFDISTICFAPANHAMDDHKEHINIGFAPFSPGIDGLYLYGYSHPMPDDFVPTLPEGTHWETEAFKGICLPYEMIARQPDPVLYVEQMCLAIHSALGEAFA